jgi:hypothetical protein
MSETPEQREQSAKFGYKAPESVYAKHDPKATLVGSGTSVTLLSRLLDVEKGRTRRSILLRLKSASTRMMRSMLSHIMLLSCHQ